MNVPETLGRMAGASVMMFLPATIMIGILIRMIYKFQRRRTALGMARTYMQNGKPLPEFLRHELDL